MFCAASAFFLSCFLLLLNFDLSGQHPLIVLIVAGQQGGRIQPVGAFCLALVQCRQPSIFFILAWPSGLSCAADGERRSSRDMRAQLLISMPAGQGIQ